MESGGKGQGIRTSIVRPPDKWPHSKEWIATVLACDSLPTHLLFLRIEVLNERSNMHALIIEDEYLIGQSLRDMLENLGFTSFSFARSEDAAITAANGEKIDLITADVRLLPGDGVSAVEKICESHAIPVVFITGYADELHDRAPAAVVVQKPVKASQLEAAVGNVLRGRGE